MVRSIEISSGHVPSNAVLYRRVSSGRAGHGTRTHTALRPPAPKAGVSAISPTRHGQDCGRRRARTAINIVLRPGELLCALGNEHTVEIDVDNRRGELIAELNHWVVLGKLEHP